MLYYTLPNKNNARVNDADTFTRRQITSPTTTNWQLLCTYDTPCVPSVG